MCPTQGLCICWSLSLECSSQWFLMTPFLPSFKFLLECYLIKEVSLIIFSAAPTSALLPCHASCLYTMTAILNSYCFIVCFSQLECQHCQAGIWSCVVLGCVWVPWIAPAHSRCSTNICNKWVAKTTAEMFLNHFLLLLCYSCPKFSPFALLRPSHSPLP